MHTYVLSTSRTVSCGDQESRHYHITGLWGSFPLVSSSLLREAAILTTVQALQACAALRWMLTVRS